MAKKELSRERLARCIELARRYYHDYESDVLEEMLDTCNSVDAEAGLTMHTTVELVCSIVRPSGLKPNATVEDIYKVLEALGWQVVADEPAEH